MVVVVVSSVLSDTVYGEFGSIFICEELCKSLQCYLNVGGTGIVVGIENRY
jgi:hypothetical protein